MKVLEQIEAGVGVVGSHFVVATHLVGKIHQRGQIMYMSLLVRLFMSPGHLKGGPYRVFVCAVQGNSVYFQVMVKFLTREGS